MATLDTRARSDFLVYSHTVGLCTMEGRGFYYPMDTDIAKDGRMYVVNRSLEGDNRGVRVTMCNVESEFLGIFSSYGEGDGQFVFPTSIALDSQGNVFVGDEYTQRISVFDASGTFLHKWGTPGSGPGEIDGPSGLTFDADDNLYVVDHKNDRIQKFTREGQVLAVYGSGSPGDVQLSLPWGMTVAPNGELYVADWRNDRIQRITPDGKPIATYGTPGDGDGELHRPSSVAVDGEGYMYVADWGNERVQVLDPDGGFVMKSRGQATLSKWGEDFFAANVEEAEARAESDLEPPMNMFEGDLHDESSHIEKLFWAPVSVLLDDIGRLYVTESNRHRIQVFQPGASRV